MSTAAKPLVCAGLINNDKACCEVRERCSRFTPWHLDGRAVFNACLPTGNARKYFIGIEAAALSAKLAPQVDLFA